MYMQHGSALGVEKSCRDTPNTAVTQGRALTHFEAVMQHSGLRVLAGLA